MCAALGVLAGCGGSDVVKPAPLVEFKPTARNISILLLSRFDVDQTEQRRKIEEALSLLERQTLIQRNGEVYEFLTNEEKDVEAEIKAISVDPAEIERHLHDLAIPRFAFMVGA